jgi:predicted permease
VVLARARSFWRTLWRRRRFEDDLDDELRFHVEARADDLVRAGMSPDEARRRARVELGAAAAHKEDVRAARGLGLVDEIAADLRFALRGWRRHRGLALAVIAILTIGIGISTAVFTLLNAGLLRPQVRLDPASFVRVFVGHAQAPKRPDGASPPEIDDVVTMEGGTRSLAALGGARKVSARLGGDPGDTRGLLVTGEYFQVYRARPLLGRLIEKGDCRDGAAVMVLREDLWRRLGADPEIVGKVVSYNRRPFTVIGVMAGKMDGGLHDRSAVFIPHTHRDLWPPLARWDGRFETAARLRPGHRRADAAAELNMLMRQQDARHPGRESRVVVTDGSYIDTPGKSHVIFEFALLLGLLAMLLLLVCSNVVSLLLARAHARSHEIAIRLSLGAGRGRLMRMLAVETLPLAAVAAGLSWLLAQDAPRLLVSYLDDDPRDIPLHPDWRVWIFVAGVTLLAALASGLTPAFEALKVNLVDSLKGRPAAAADGRRRPRLRDLLVVAQIAVTVVLLAGAGLFVRGYASLSWENRGYDSRHTLMAYLRAWGDDPPSWPAVHQAVRAELRVAPAIEVVAFAETTVPGGQHLRLVRMDGAASVASALAQMNGVSPDLFATLSVPLLRGRTFLPGESATGPVVPVILSNRLARDLWKSDDPLGGQLRTEEGHRFQVVGVVGDVERPGGKERGAIYRPLRPGPAAVVVRFSGDAAAASATVEAAVRRAAPGVGAWARSFQARDDRDAARLARVAAVILVVGGCAMLVALVGVYGTVAFTVRRRTKEMAIRVALGARAADVVHALVTPTARAVGAGLLIGVTLAFLLAPGLRSQAGELAFRDPLVYAATAVLLGAAALAAMVRPVLRALSLDQIGPAAILREDG